MISFRFEGFDHDRAMCVRGNLERKRMKPTSLKLAVAVLLGLVATQAAHATDAVLTGDASVNSAHPTTNYGALSNLYVGNGTTSLLQFDLSVLPSGTTASQISNATLRLYVNRVNAAGSVTVSPVTSSWTESAVTYATAPAIGSSFATFTASNPETFVSVDVTSLVQGWVTTPASNYGLALTSAAANVLLDAKENDETAHVAGLDITITSQGATGATGATGAQGIQCQGRSKTLPMGRSKSRPVGRQEVEGFAGRMASGA